MEIHFQDSPCHFMEECIDSTPTQRGHTLCTWLSEGGREGGRDSHVPVHVITCNMYDFKLQTFETKIQTKLTQETS
jgi:hypothetical protein